MGRGDALGTQKVLYTTLPSDLCLPVGTTAKLIILVDCHKLTILFIYHPVKALKQLVDEGVASIACLGAS